MSHKKDIHNTGSVWGGTGWYMVMLCQYNLELLGIKWYWVSKVPLCQNILKKKKRRFGWVSPIPDRLGAGDIWLF